MSHWRFPAAFGCLVASWGILLHFTSGLPWWAGFLAGAFYSLGVVWMRDDAKREQRREDERDAWVQKVATAQGVNGCCAGRVEYRQVMNDAEKEQVRRLHTADEFGAWCCHCASTCAPSGVRH